MQTIYHFTITIQRAFKEFKCVHKSTLAPLVERAIGSWKNKNTHYYLKIDLDIDKLDNDQKNKLNIKTVGTFSILMNEYAIYGITM